MKYRARNGHIYTGNSAQIKSMMDHDFSPRRINLMIQGSRILMRIVYLPVWWALYHFVKLAIRYWIFTVNFMLAYCAYKFILQGNIIYTIFTIILMGGIIYSYTLSRKNTNKNNKNRK